ncbi:serine/threonine protein kinase [Singulisphaera rosea]
MDSLTSKHPENRILVAYGLGKLDDDLSLHVDEHLEQCANCRRRVAELSPDSFLGRLRDIGNSALNLPGPGASVVGTIGRDSAIGEQVTPTVDSLPPGLANHLDYEIKQELGRGGMGVVYLAHNSLMGRDEVLKVISGKVMERPGVLDRFQREIRAVANLQHPNIVTAYTAFRIEGGLVFAMEYVEGLDLSRLVKAKGPLAVGHVAYFGYQVALGLQHAHERGTVHRDIKPQNLMLTHDGSRRLLKVLDFGLAKANREESHDLRLTHEGQALGTPDYIAPEQILNSNRVDIRADLYSLGGTLYYLLTGRPPFLAKSLYDVYQSHISREADPLNLIRPEVPSELAALVAKLMAKEPARRFQTPGAAAEALLPFFKNRTTVKTNSRVDTNRPQIAIPIDTRTLETPSASHRPKHAPAPKVIEGRGEDLDVFREIVLSTNESSSSELRSVPADDRARHRTRWPLWAAAAGFNVLMLGVVVYLKTKDTEIKVDLGEPKSATRITLAEDGKPLVDLTVDPRPGVQKPATTPGTPPDSVKQDSSVKDAESKLDVDERKSATSITRVEHRQGAPAARTVPLKPTPRYPVKMVWNSPWRMSQDELVIRRAGSHSMLELTRRVNLADFTVEAEAKREQGNGFIEFHFGAAKYVTFGLQVVNDRSVAFLRHFDNGQFESGPAPVPLDVAHDDETWAHLRVEKKGDLIVYFVNHREIFQEADDVITYGTINVATVNANARFRNIKATGEDGKLLLEGLPDLPELEESR